VGKCTDRRRMVVMVILLFPFSSEGDIMIEFQVIGSVVRIWRHEEGIAPKELAWLLVGLLARSQRQMCWCWSRWWWKRLWDNVGGLSVFLWSLGWLTEDVAELKLKSVELTWKSQLK